MNRREWTLATATLAALPGFALAQASGEPREGREYAVLEKRVPTEVPAGKVEVVEFFWYSCPHCNAYRWRSGRISSHSKSSTTRWKR